MRFLSYFKELDGGAVEQWLSVFLGAIDVVPEGKFNKDDTLFSFD